MHDLVSIALLNWNGLDFLAGCLDSVFAQTYPNVEIIVVDNASSDDSVPWLEEHYGGKITLITNPVNTGFSKGMNIGMKAAKGRYIMPLNFDIIMDENYIAEMVTSINSGDNVGSVSGKLLRFDANGKSNVIDSTGHLIYNNRYVVNRGEDEVDEGQYDRSDSVFGTCGAAPLYKKQMLDDIAYEGQYYDEAFFIMLEDVDIDWRAQLRGWQSVYAPKAVAYHFRGGSGSGKSRLIQRHYYKNRYLLMWQNDTLLSILKSYPAVWLMDVYLGLDILFTSPPALVLALVDLVRLRSLAMRKRRFVQSRRKIAQNDIEVWFNKYRWLNDVKRKLGIKSK